MSTANNDILPSNTNHLEKGSDDKQKFDLDLLDKDLESDIVGLWPKVITYGIMFLQGLGTVLPWNVLITATDYFHHEFKGSSYENNFQNYFAAIFMGVQLIFLIPAIVTQKKHTLFKRILTNLVVVNLVFLFLLILPFLESFELTSNTKFMITMIPLVVCGAAGVFAITDVYGLASIFPPIYIQGVMAGQAIGGVAVALIQFVIYFSALSNPEAAKSDEDSVVTRGKAYFGVALAISLINLMSLLLFPKVPLFRHYVHGNSLTQVSQVATTSMSQTFGQRFSKIMQALRQVWVLALSVMLVFIVTMAIFPSITAAVRTSADDPSPLYKALFVSIHFVLFNVGDLVGRLLLSSNVLRPKSPKFILILALIRCIFFFIFLTSQLDLGSSELNARFPKIFTNDAAFFILLLVFSVSSGYLGSGSMVLAPSIARSTDDIPLIGNVMAFALTMGLALGSFLSFALRAGVCQCNSFLT